MAKEDDANGRTIVIGEQLDIEAYAALYSGRTKINRLRFIADKCGGSPMELEALKMAYDESKKGEDTQLFKDIVAKIDGRLGPNYGPDDAWADAVDRRFELMEEKFKNNLRVGEAFENSDYCSTTKHIVDMCFKLILVSIEMGMFYRVVTYVDEAEKCQDALDIITIAKLCCARGLAHLEDREYKLAALKFLGTSPDIGNTFSEVIAPRDIAIYGGLCALASFDRAELKSKVIDNGNFQKFLKLVPKIRELINNFYAGQYTSVFEYLEILKATLLLDFHLHDHVEDLYAQIREKALIQYTLSPLSIDLRMMANEFRTSVIDLEEELALLIVNNKIQALIDSQKSTLLKWRLDSADFTLQLRD